MIENLYKLSTTGPENNGLHSTETVPNGRSENEQWWPNSESDLYENEGLNRQKIENVVNVVLLLQ